jgi:hypothetical protein
MAAEHVLSYICQIFREYDIRLNGKPDVNGVPRAKRESLLKTIETFYDCLLLGYSLRHLTGSRKIIHDYPFYTYWICVDLTIMVFSLGYNYMS